MILYHPAIIILICSILLTILKQNKNLFPIIPIASPLTASYFLYYLPEQNSLSIENFILIYEGSFHNKLIGIAFLIVLFSVNIYSLG